MVNEIWCQTWTYSADEPNLSLIQQAGFTDIILQIGEMNLDNSFRFVPPEDEIQKCVDWWHSQGSKYRVFAWVLGDVGDYGTDEQRQQLAQNCVDLVQTYGFDGMDLDIEFNPGSGSIGQCWYDLMNLLTSRMHGIGKLNGSEAIAWYIDQVGQSRMASLNMDYVRVQLYDGFIGDWVTEIKRYIRQYLQWSGCPVILAVSATYPYEPPFLEELPVIDEELAALGSTPKLAGFAVFTYMSLNSENLWDAWINWPTKDKFSVGVVVSPPPVVGPVVPSKPCIIATVLAPQSFLLPYLRLFRDRFVPFRLQCVYYSLSRMLLRGLVRGGERVW